MESVYFMKEIDKIVEDNNVIIKIGKSGNVQKRLKSLKTGNSSELTTLEEFNCSNCKILEDTLHNIFNNNCIGGEWFKLSQSEYKFGVDLSNKPKDIINYISQLLVNVKQNKSITLLNNIVGEIADAEKELFYINIKSINKIDDECDSADKIHKKIKSYRKSNDDKCSSDDCSSDESSSDEEIKACVQIKKKPAVKKSELECIPCKFTATTKSNLKKHFLTDRHLHYQKKRDQLIESRKKFICEICKFKSKNEFEMLEHKKSHNKLNTDDGFELANKIVKLQQIENLNLLLENKNLKTNLKKLQKK